MSKHPYLLKEDYWAIWIGAFLLLLGLILFFVNAPEKLEDRHSGFIQTMDQELEIHGYKTIAWYEAFDQQQKIKSTSEPIGKWFKTFTNKPGGWSSNPLDAFWISAEKQNQKQAAIAQQYNDATAREAAAKEVALKAQQSNNQIATVEAINNWRTIKSASSKTAKKYKQKAFNKVGWLVLLFLFFVLIFGLANAMMGHAFISFAKGFGFVFLIAILSYLLASQVDMKAIGFGYAAWAILIGLLISNTIGTPQVLKPALLTTLYIKTGLVLLGAEILFGKILAIGLPGIFVAWVVTPIVLVSTYWFGQRVLKISSKTLNMTISADMSVCGVSAAVATAAACKASKEELTLAIGLSMIFTSVMMIVLPGVINALGLPEVLGGAWIGGTIDATGAVVAAGAFLGDTALSVAATIKMIQNVLIGIIAFGVAIYFATKVENQEAKVGWGEIWKRFPKFILGFIGASVLMSLIYSLLGDAQGYTLIDHGVIRGFSKNIRGWLFCLAFVSIGLSTNFKELRSHFTGGKPLILYLCGQLFNLCLTLLMAYIMFYLVFPDITANI